ncbi:phage tail tube protein [Rhizobium leguminosarum]|uniref:phage tail tube protein n=1 Tax=Rhizobium leguminosarum TaxID=384 RepID=UPI0021BBBDD7|nr:phage tail tube protein [Rhizobium leguminosarum]
MLSFRLQGIQGPWKPAFGKSAENRRRLACARADFYIIHLYRGGIQPPCRMNTLDLQLNAKQNVTANWGVMGIGSPNPDTAIVTGATYTDPTTTPVLNAALAAIAAGRDRRADAPFAAIS